MHAERRAYEKEAWLTKDHVNIVLASMCRSAAKGYTSMYTAWCEYDSCAISDSTIKKAVTKNKFQAIWDALAFMDYQNAHWGEDGELLEGVVYDDKGKVKSVDKIARVRWYVRAAEKRWDANWTAGQVWVAWHGMAWYGVAWYGMVWYGMVWYGMVWYGMVWLLWYGMVTMAW